MRSGRVSVADHHSIEEALWLGAVFPSVVKQQKFDIANGVDITFVERPPDAYATEFNAGDFPVGGSASAMILSAVRRGPERNWRFVENLGGIWGCIVLG